MYHLFNYSFISKRNDVPTKDEVSSFHPGENVGVVGLLKSTGEEKSILIKR